METYEIYLVKSVVSVTVLYLFYWFILRNEIHHQWNRLFLLGSLVISLLFPAFNFSVTSISPGTFINSIKPAIVNGYISTTESIRTHNTLSILSIIYISGAAFMVLRFLSNMAKILYLYLRFPKYRFRGFIAVVIDNKQSPFTFFNILFISNVDFESGIIDEMIVHERAHKEGHHSVDILLLEGLTIIQWFNPFVWMFAQSLKSEHEFYADNRVLLEGFDKVKYQKLLFEKCLGVAPLYLTSNFYNSLLKKRLKMMTMKKSSKMMKAKYLLSIPMLFITVFILTTSSSYGQDKKVYTDVDVPAVYKDGGMDGLSKLIQQNITYPESARKNNVSAKVYVQFVINENGKVSNVEIVRNDILNNLGKEVVVVGYSSDKNPEIDSKSVADLETEAIRVIWLLKDFEPAQKNGKKVKTQFTYPIYFVLEDKNK